MIKSFSLKLPGNETRPESSLEKIPSDSSGHDSSTSFFRLIAAVILATLMITITSNLRGDDQTRTETAKDLAPGQANDGNGTAGWPHLHKWFHNPRLKGKH